MSQHDPNFRPGLDSQGFPLKPKKTHKVRNILLTIGAAFVVMVGGCTAIVASSSDEAFTPTPSPTVTVTPAAVPSSEATTEAPAETTETEEPAKDTAKIGETLTYKSGIVVRVVSVKSFKPGMYASGLTAGHKAVKVTWTVENKTGESLDLQGAQARLTYGADGEMAESVYTDGVGGMYPFEGSLSNGKKKTATSAFSVPKSGLSQITVEVEPEFGSQTAFFTGAAK